MGFNQILGLDYKEIFSSIIKPVIIRTVLSLDVTQRWPLGQLNVNNVFFHGHLMERLYMKQPPGFKILKNQIMCDALKRLSTDLNKHPVLGSQL